MKILLLGATGRTGKEIIKEAIKREHQVSAIARDPEKLKGFAIEITQGTPYDYATVEKAIRGCDAVINTLNVSRTSDSLSAPLAAPKNMISKAAENAITAMGKAGINRYVALGAIGAGSSWKKMPWIFKLMVNLTNLKYALQDHGRQEELLEKSSLDYTVCRAPILTSEPNDSGAVVVPEGSKPPTFKLSRSAAAAFFLDIIEKKQYLREIISVVNKPG